MEKSEAYAVLSDFLEKYRAMSYQELVKLIGKEDISELRSMRGHQYQIELQVFWDNKPNGDLRIIGSIDDGGLRALRPFTSDFIVSEHGIKAEDR